MKLTIDVVTAIPLINTPAGMAYFFAKILRFHLLLI